MLPLCLAALSLILTWALIMPLRFSRMQGDTDTPFTFLLKAIPTAAAAAFACCAALMPAAAPCARWMAAGLLVCLTADVVLGIRFEVGGGLFLLGHICYIIGLMSLQTLSPANGVILLIALAVLEGLLYTCRGRMPNRLLACGVYVYAAALATLLAAALPLPFTVGGRGATLAAVGAILFVLSDATLCDNMLNDRPRPNQYVSLGIYYTAQLFLGMSVLAVL